MILETYCERNAYRLAQGNYEIYLSDIEKNIFTLRQIVKSMAQKNEVMGPETHQWHEETHIQTRVDQAERSPWQIKV